GVTDPEEYLDKIKASGYATSLKYVPNLMAVIEKYNLTQYDKETEESAVAKKVFLSAGHGGSNPGAVANGLKESDINLNTLLACKEVLEKHGVTVVASRLKDEEDDVYEEVKEANASGAEIAVSFHANAGGGDGFEVFYHNANAKGKWLSQLCEKYVLELGQNSRGIKSGNDLYFIKNTKMTSVLVESFFLDNAKDKEIGDTVAKQKAFGVAYAKAILEYLGISYLGSETASKEETAESSAKLYRVQVGAYKIKSNAEAMLQRLEVAGFKGFITEV
ncbi:MAG: N-acetylmuramoyl-L-alanine amidase, partial [Lachnospiraceae bacterium]